MEEIKSKINELEDQADQLIGLGDLFLGDPITSTSLDLGHVGKIGISKILKNISYAIMDIIDEVNEKLKE